MKRKRQQPPTPRPKARSADVLGKLAGGESRVRPKWRKYYRRLNEVRNYLVNRQGDQAKDVAGQVPVFSMHMADAGTEEFDRNFSFSMMSSEQEALYEF